MKKNTTLQKIVAEAKRIQKVHTHMSWKEAIKDAAKHIKEGATTKLKKTSTRAKITPMNAKDIELVFRNNEKHNMHAENVVLLAKYFGTKKDYQEANKIREEHKRLRYLSPDLAAKRDLLYNKLMKKAVAKGLFSKGSTVNGWHKGSTAFIEQNEKPYSSAEHNFRGYRVPKNSLFGKSGTWIKFEQINGTAKKGRTKYKEGHEIIIGKVADKLKLTKVVPEVKVKINRGKKTSADKVTSIKDAVSIIRRWITKNKIETQEYFIVMYLDRGNKVLGIYLNTIGTMTSVIIDTKLVIATGLQLGAESVIICHNHPSGTLAASKADLSFTRDFVRAANYLGLRVEDHIILTKDSYFSFVENGYIK